MGAASHTLTVWRVDWVCAFLKSREGEGVGCAYPMHFFYYSKFFHQVSPCTSPGEVGGRGHRGKGFCTSEAPSIGKGTIRRRDSVVYVTCCWVGSHSWRPYEWGMSTISCPQQPCSVPIDSRLWLFLMEPFHFIFGLPLLLLPSISPSVIVFTIEPCFLMMCLK